VRFQTVEARNDLGIAEFRQVLRRFQSQADGADVAHSSISRDTELRRMASIGSSQSMPNWRKPGIWNTRQSN